MEKEVGHTNEYVDIVVSLVNLLNVDTYVESELDWGGPFRNVRPFVRRAIGIDERYKSTVQANEEIFGMSIKEYVGTLEKRRADEFIDLLYLNSNRDYEEAMNELTLLSPYVKTCKGLILIQNTHPIAMELTLRGCCGDAWRVARALHENETYQHYYEVVTLPGPCTGISIIRKAPYHLTWNREINKRAINAGFPTRNPRRRKLVNVY